MESPRSRASPVRRLLLLLPALAFVGLLGAGLVRSDSGVGPGSPAPEFRAPVLGEQGTLALSDLRGKPVVLNFWASWCVPCRHEAPLLNRAYESYGDRVHFVGVNIRDARSDALAFERRHGTKYPSVRDESLAIHDAYGLTGQPETFFIDARGVIVSHVPGPVFASDLPRLVQQLLGG